MTEKKKTTEQKLNSYIKRSMKKIYDMMKEISPDDMYIDVCICQSDNGSKAIMWNVGTCNKLYGIIEGHIPMESSDE